MSTARALEPSDGPDHAPLLEQVHDPAGPGEAHPQLALQHRGGAELGAHDQVHRGEQQVVIVVGPAAAGAAGTAAGVTLTPST